jgi:transposase
MSKSKAVVRKIQEYFLKGKEIFVGLEDSKRTWRISVRSERREVHYASMPARYEVLAAFLRNKFPDCTVHLVYEAGFKGFNLYDRLTADGYGCTVVPPHTIHQEKCSRVKNDRIDAQLLAKNLEDGNCKACYVPDEERRVDRQWARILSDIHRKIVTLKNQIRKTLDFHGIETGMEGKAWNDGQYKALRTLELPPEHRLWLDVYLNMLDYLLAEQKNLKAKLQELAKKERYANAFRIAASLPGVGELTAIRLVLELGEDFSRFKSGAEIASFIGLGGSEYSTGETVRRGGITKQGNALIRAWLIQCAWVAIKHDPAMQEFYSRIRRNSAVAQKAITAVARKLIVRMRSCIVNNVEYAYGVIE